MGPLNRGGAVRQDTWNYRLGAIESALPAAAKDLISMSCIANPFIQEDCRREHQITPVTRGPCRIKFITLHLPLNDNTYHLIDQKAISMMKPSAIIVNVSRGGIIDEDAAYEALVSGRLGGLGLDAFEKRTPNRFSAFTLQTSSRHHIPAPIRKRQPKPWLIWLWTI